jgi:hypothetical protein
MFFFTGAVVAGSSACGQCPGGGQGGGTTGTTTAVGATAADLTPLRVLTGPGSLAFDMMMAQRIAQQRYMLAMQQAQARQERLAVRRQTAAKKRADMVEGRSRAKSVESAQSTLAAAPAARRASP